MSFWMVKDTQRKGWLSLSEATDLLVALKFSIADSRLTYTSLKEEFKFNLKTKPGELKDTDTIVRFDFIRDIFLERGL